MFVCNETYEHEVCVQRHVSDWKMLPSEDEQRELERPSKLMLLAAHAPATTLKYLLLTH